MSNLMNISICGKEYTLRTDEDQNYINSLARYVEKKINAITTENPNVTQSSAAVVVAFKAYDDLSQVNRTLDNLRTDMEKVKTERDAAVRELEIIKSKINQIEGNYKLRQLKESINNGL